MNHPKVFYHIYPLGLLGAPKKNKLHSPPKARLTSLDPWLRHLHALGCNALYLGPVFESTSHGYDTADYFTVDRRLGTNADLKVLVSKARAMGIKVVLDAVFNHVGRDFWAFKDLQIKGKRSKYKNWFSNVDFSKKGKQGDGFSYDCWHGHYQLVELNLQNPEVRSHLFSAVADWIDNYQIDGLRLDAADVIDLSFLEALNTFCKGRKSDFWLLGEVVFGDYKHWVNTKMLDSVTNYEYHMPLLESFNHSHFEKIARVLRRQFGINGVYKNLNMYSFVDNHDVDRAASALVEPAHLYPMYLLLFTMPGMPALYYGSEWGFEGRVQKGKHYELRPKVNLKKISGLAKHPLLIDAIKRFITVRLASNALVDGSYHELLVRKEQFVFARVSKNDFVICIVNASMHSVSLDIHLHNFKANRYKDLLNMDYTGTPNQGVLRIRVPSCWGRVLSPLD